MVLANWLPKDTQSAKYHAGGIPAGGVYSNPIRSIFPFLPTLSILQDRDLSYRSAEYEMPLENWIPKDTHRAEYPINGLPASRGLS